MVTSTTSEHQSPDAATNDHPTADIEEARRGGSSLTIGIARPPATTKIKELRVAAKTCQACPLYKTGTQTVFGEGANRARIMFVGEQPGDKEDRLGKPFVGPAGQLLDRALEDAGVNRADCYVTNAVKHFKWEPSGKRRLHKKPNSREMAACRPWLLSELEAVRPEIIVCLGVTAARSVLQRLVKIGKERGVFIDGTFAGKVLVTVHPSSLLRVKDKLDKMRAWQAFVGDLRMLRSEFRES